MSAPAWPGSPIDWVARSGDIDCLEWKAAMNGSDASTRTGSTGVAPPIRILEHTLIDICDLLEATFGLDGVDVTFSRRSAGVDRRWQGRLGDWLVADSDANWFVVSDAEFGRLRSEPAAERSELGPQVADLPAGQPRPIAS